MVKENKQTKTNFFTTNSDLSPESRNYIKILKNFFSMMNV